MPNLVPSSWVDSSTVNTLQTPLLKPNLWQYEGQSNELSHELYSWTNADANPIKKVIKSLLILNFAQLKCWH